MYLIKRTLDVIVQLMTFNNLSASESYIYTSQGPRLIQFLMVDWGQYHFRVDRHCYSRGPVQSVF